ncbi:aldo/keto reductase [Corynebacterium hylobatis]|uniref:Aldo/keto reductase n=1 Tax=Corynebacterium hylobatis TaxID=1859290 RepID=A0A3S0B308_9CORY|nr:aldo/keto reductase [Corynebacterium hylobatis]RSZ61467.1 aldo/keto reductase [Corynebacterium hylobatis]
MATVTLNDGTDIPQIGMGTWGIQGEEGLRLVRAAIELGYRHFDTASAYGNEEVVGRAVTDAIAAGDVTREELFITTKVWQDEQGTDAVPLAFRASLDRLGLDYVDLYLVHWPAPELGRYVESFEAIARLQGLGLVQSIGVSNFYEEILREVVEKAGIVPAVNQVELHPGFSQAPLRELHTALGVTTAAWSPLGRGRLLSNPVLDAVARAVGRSAAQVALRWVMQLGCVAIPGASHPKRLAQNLAAADFTLSREQMAAITGLGGESGFGRFFEDPRTFGNPGF